jgi:hypothetical protein
MRVRAERSLNVSEAIALHSPRAEVRVEQTNMSENEARTEEIGLRIRRCRNCNRTGNNAQTCTVESLVAIESNDI